MKIKNLALIGLGTIVTTLAFKYFLLKKNSSNSVKKQEAAAEGENKQQEKEPTATIATATTSESKAEGNTIIVNPYISKENIEKANQQKAIIKKDIEALTIQLKSLPRMPDNRDKAKDLKNKINLLNAKLRLL